jgi:WD40 repeat protein
MANTDPTDLPPQPTGPSEAATIGPDGGATGAADAAHQKVRGYEILAELGRGGMGVVYKARQVALDRVVALKMILGGGHTDPATLARFQTEALAVAKLQHPNIVQIYETGQQDELPYLALEYVEGRSLDQHLAGRPMPPREAAALVQTLARAVHAAHGAGVIHRDLKPANVLLTADRVPKITDFGLAKSLGDDRGQTASGAVLGTPSYMAPEQAGGRRREITPAVDVYSLGAILYECLTGRPPFRAETPLDTLLLVVSEEVTPPSEVCRAVPRELEAICLKCLQKQPQNRYADALALAEDLQRVLNGEPVSACKATLEQQAWRWLKKRPFGGPILLLMVCVALFSAGALTYIEPSRLMLTGWVVWIAAVTALFFWLPDRRGLAVAGYCSLLFARVGWHATWATQLPDSFAHQLSMAWIYATTALFFLVPSRRGGMAKAFICFLIFCSVINTSDATWRFTPDVFLHLIGVGVCCVVARLIAWVAQGDHPTAVFAGVSAGILSYRSSPLPGLYQALLGPHADPPPTAWWTLLGLLICACGAFLSTQVTSVPARRRWRRTIGRMLSPLATVRLRAWLGVAAGCLLLLLVRGAWLWATGRELFTLEALAREQGAVCSVAFSPDGARLATGAMPQWTEPDGNLTVITWARSDNLEIWDVKTGKKVRGCRAPHGSPGYGVAFSPDGTRLAVATHFPGAPVSVLSAADDRELLVPQGFLGEGTRSLAFSADGKRLAAGGVLGTIKVWDAVTGHGLLSIHTSTGAQVAPRILGPGSPVTCINSVAFSPDGTRLATCAMNETVTLWDATTGKEIKTLRKGANKVAALNYCFGSAFSPDGKRLAAGGLDKMVRVWDVGTGREILSLAGHAAWVQGVAFSPDGKWLASAGHDRVVCVWDATTGHEWLRLKGHTASVYCVAFSPDSGLLASGSEDGTVKIWRIAD